jgi:hypothetical protein
MKLPYDQIFEEQPRLIFNKDNLRELRTGLAELHPDEPLSIENLRHVLKEHRDAFIFSDGHPAVLAPAATIDDVQSALVLYEFDYIPNEKNLSKILRWMWQNEQSFTLENAKHALTELGSAIERT